MKERDKFGSRLGFILVSAGCAVGLGNVWKFPYICGQNGGAAFILIYLVFLTILGLPILISEFAVGRGSRFGVAKAYEKLEPEGTKWHHFKWFSIFGNYLLMMFYTMVGGWMLFYIYRSASGTLASMSADEVGTPKHCPAAAQNRQFVFWSEANFVPVWHMNNELLYCYEFAETWSDLSKGCFEPMSDRLLAHAKVDIIENNKVRKVVKYHYALVNPDYKAPYPDGIYPEVDEYYTFYADGVGVRRIEYIQKQAGQAYYRYHELSEPMVISGSSSIPSDHVKQPAFSISNLSGNRYDLYPAKPFDEVNQNVKNWKEQIYTAHLNNAPDAFSVFSYTPERPEVSPLPIENDLTWHDINYQMSHWPVDKQPYLNARYGDYDKSTATWPSQVSHSSLIGVEAKGDVSWNTAYQINSDGNKYRVYLMLLGINQPDAASDIDAYTRGWLYMGSPTNLNGVSYNPDVTGYSKREMVLMKTTGTGSCQFTCNPTGAVKNPVFRIDNWTGSGNVTVKVGGKTLVSDSDYLSDKVGGSLVIWLNKTISSTFSVEIIPV